MPSQTAEESRKMETQHSERKFYFEVMRIVAAFFVIFNHSGGYFLFPQYASEPMRFQSYLFLSVFTKFAVPLFFAISGALLLNRPQEPMKKLWCGRIFKFALILLLGSFFAYLEDIGALQDPAVLKTAFMPQVFIKQIYSIELRTHFWYLYAYIAFLIVLPFLRTLVRNLDTRYFYYMIIIALFSKALFPMAEYLVWKGDYTLNPNFNIAWLAQDVVLFPCIGYFLEHRSKMHQSGRKVLCLWIANILCILIACRMTCFRGNLLGGYDPRTSEYFHKSFDLVGCITMYVTIRWLCGHVKFPQICRQLIVSCSACSFGIYLFHFFLPFHRVNQQLGLWIPYPMTRNLVFCGFQLIACWLITWVLKQIPVIRKLL